MSVGELPCHHQALGFQQVHEHQWLPGVQQSLQVLGYHALPETHTQSVTTRECVCVCAVYSWTGVREDRWTHLATSRPWESLVSGDTLQTKQDLFIVDQIKKCVSECVSQSVSVFVCVCLCVCVTYSLSWLASLSNSTSGARQTLSTEHG